MRGCSRKKRSPKAMSSAALSDKNGKGLRYFSLRVSQKVEEKGCTTYNEVRRRAPPPPSLVAPCLCLPSSSLSFPFFARCPTSLSAR